MEVYFHIGLEKTGTTSLQHFFSANRYMLAHEGVLYPRSTGELTHHRLVIYSRDVKERDDLNIRTGLTEDISILKFKSELSGKLDSEISATKPKPNKLIFSSEHLSSRLINQNTLKILKEFVAPYSNNPKVIAYLRRQDEFLMSTYSTQVISGYTKDFDVPEIDQKILNRYDYYLLLKNWSSVFGIENIIVRVYDKDELLQGDVIHDFIALTGISWNKSFITPDKKNMSYSHNHLEFIKRFNVYVPCFKNLNLNPDRADILYVLNKIAADKSKATYWGDNIDKFYRHFTESNKNVAHEFLQRNDGILFRDEPARKDQSAVLNAFTLNEAMEIFSKIWIFKTEELRDLKEQAWLLECELAIRKGMYNDARKWLKKIETSAANKDKVEMLYKLLQSRERSGVWHKDIRVFSQLMMVFRKKIVSTLKAHNLLSTKNQN